MRRLLVTLLPLLLACDRPPVAPEADAALTLAATSGWTETIIDLGVGGFKWYAPCIDDMLDEVGRIEQSIHTVSTDNGSLFYLRIRILDGFHLVGDETGNWYPKTGSPRGGTLLERGSSENGNYVFHFNLDPYMYVNATTGVVMNNPLRQRITMTADGEVTVDHLVEPCSIVGQ